MKNRTLKRPMFRKGGPAMEGIMTGIQDRTNYNEGGRATELAEEYAKLLRRMAPSPTDRSLPQFLIQGGLNLVSGKGATGNTLRDVASAYQQPTAGLFKGIQARDAYDSQVGMAAAKAGISGAQSEKEAALKARAKMLGESKYLKDESPLRYQQKLFLEYSKAPKDRYAELTLTQTFPLEMSQFNAQIFPLISKIELFKDRIAGSTSIFNSQQGAIDYSKMSPGLFYFDPAIKKMAKKVKLENGQISYETYNLDGTLFNKK